MVEFRSKLLIIHSFDESLKLFSCFSFIYELILSQSKKSYENRHYAEHSQETVAKHYSYYFSFCAIVGLIITYQTTQKELIIRLKQKSQKCTEIKTLMQLNNYFLNFAFTQNSFKYRNYRRNIEPAHEHPEKQS